MQSGEIVVSISCITYNHAPYIRQCLDGFMMQQTNFAFEVLIHDDASTDGTTEIIKEYEREYPDIVKPIYEEENQWVKGRRGSAVFNFPRAKGKYIAMCEGDDYWTDPLKLQKQVDFLESNPEYSICSHGVCELIQDLGIFKENEVIKSFTYNLDFLIRGGWAYNTLSVMFKLSQIDHNYRLYMHSKDMSLFYSLLKNGKGYYMTDVMAIYRVHSNGVWSGLSRKRQFVSDFRNRLGICDVEKSKESAVFLLSLWDKAWGRSLMFEYAIIFLKSFVIFINHFGFYFAIKLFVNKILFNKTFPLECLKKL